MNSGLTWHLYLAVSKGRHLKIASTNKLSQRKECYRMYKSSPDYYLKITYTGDNPVEIE